MSICNGFNCALIVFSIYVIVLALIVQPFVKKSGFKFSWWDQMESPDKNRTAGTIILILGVITSLIIKLVAEGVTENKWEILFQAEIIMAVSSAVGAAFISHGFSQSLNGKEK